MAHKYVYKVPYSEYGVTEMGQRIDDLMFEKGVSATAIEEACGISRKTIYGMKKGNKCKFISVVKVANYFGASLDWLVYGTGEKQRIKGGAR